MRSKGREGELREVPAFTQETLQWLRAALCWGGELVEHVLGTSMLSRGGEESSWESFNLGYRMGFLRCHQRANSESKHYISQLEAHLSSEEEIRHSLM